MSQPDGPRPTPTADPAVSDLLAGRYVLEERIASGGMATVWRAHDEILARTVAIKILHDDLSRLPDIRERFRREAIAAAKLVHPAVVSLFDAAEADGLVYLVIEYIEGITLAQALEDGPLDVGDACLIALRMTQALQHAHRQGIIHRDVKPANVLIGADGGAKVTDFGIAKAGDDPRITATGRVMGTAAYVAPEQLRGAQVDGAADLYSLGLVLYECLTGVQAFSGGSPVTVAEARLNADPLRPRTRRADIPRDLDDLVAALTEPDRSRRLDDAAAVVEVLTRHAIPEDVPEPVPAVIDEDEVQPVGADFRWLAPVGVLLVLAVALVAVGLDLIDSDRVTDLFVEEVTPDVEDVDVATDTPEIEVSPPAGTGQVEAVGLVGLTDFDPQGDDRERGAFLDNMLDGAPETVWATEKYRSAQFGGLKDGVGAYGDLGGNVEVTAVTLDVPVGGFGIEVRGALTPGATVSEWDLLASAEEVSAGEVRLEIPEGTATRFLLLWITGPLQPFEDGFRAEIGEVRVLALAS